MPSSRGSSQPRDQTCVSCGSWLAGGFFTTWEAHLPHTNYKYYLLILRSVTDLLRSYQAHSMPAREIGPLILLTLAVPLKAKEIFVSWSRRPGALFSRVHINILQKIPGAGMWLSQLVRLTGAKCVGPLPKSGPETSQWGLKLAVVRAFTWWKSTNFRQLGALCLFLQKVSLPTYADPLQMIFQVVYYNIYQCPRWMGGSGHQHKIVIMVVLEESALELASCVHRQAVHLPSPGLCIFLYENEGIDRIYLPPLKHFLCYLFLLYFWLLLFFLILWVWHMARGILVAQPRMEPTSPAMEAWSLNHWTTRTSPCNGSMGS